jgi:hypothetical protein
LVSSRDGDLEKRLDETHEDQRTMVDTVIADEVHSPPSQAEQTDPSALAIQ